MIKRVVIKEVSDIRIAVTNVLETARVKAILSDEKEFDIKLSLNELLTNSIKYSGSGKSVLVYMLRKNSLCCEIIDEGCGFQFENCQCAEVYQESGRGVYIVRSIADELSYNKDGNSVFFRIRLD